MNVHRRISAMPAGEMSPDGFVMIPEQIRRAAGLVPGMAVVVALNDQGETVIMSRTRARRLGESATQRHDRIAAALADAGSGRYSTGQSTAEAMADLRSNHSS